MTLFRLFLLTFLLALLAYTTVTIKHHGLALLPIFFGEIKAMAWPGQFNFDFLGFLMLSALWVVWRNDFTPVAFGLGILAFFGGMAFLTIYLLYLSYKTRGDIRHLMLGASRSE